MSLLTSLGRHPKGFWFFFWGELAERSSYYGMRAILALYMVDKLGFSEGDASTMMSIFIGGCYLLPLVGGFVADRFLGKYWTIVLFSGPYILGHVLLGVESRPFLYGALALLAMGSGVIKPNISTLMGLTYDAQRPGEDQLRSDAFGVFYMAINVGSVISTFTLPYLRTEYGYATAFLAPAVLMVISFAIFAAGKKHYAVETIQKSSATPEERAEQWAVLGRIAPIFLTVTFFWAIFDQTASTWVFFARDYMDLNLLGFKLEPDMIQGLNPFLVVFFVPVFSIIWSRLAAAGRKLKATDKMAIGFVLTGSTMALMAGAAFMTTPEAKVSIAWQMIAYVIVTMAEVCISVVGLELAYTAAPKRLKGFVTACWLVTVALANFTINAPVSQLYDKLPPWQYFGLLAAVMVPVTAAFLFFAGRFNRAQAAQAA